MPHIATWNDKDFGLNTSDTRFALKDSTLMAFNLFWPNAPKKHTIIHSENMVYTNVMIMKM
ncbi:MAG: hypothetical protein CM15mP23_19740 [Cryomorphaceae bacterium]|nr:MAG: hypothetical protein CM15mP23_19740 [Cryomorphaceae bacterium]